MGQACGGDLLNWGRRRIWDEAGQRLSRQFSIAAARVRSLSRWEERILSLPARGSSKMGEISRKNFWLRTGWELFGFLPQNLSTQNLAEPTPLGWNTCAAVTTQVRPYLGDRLIRLGV